MDLNGYREAWKLRRHREHAADCALAEEIRRSLPAMVTHLVKVYGVKRVILIGSLARGTFRKGSDVDLVVEGGLQGRQLFAAGADLERMMPVGVQVDLIPIEEAPRRLTEVLEEEGEVLHGL
jgi:predicted nucleotidyltransferase